MMTEYSSKHVFRDGIFIIYPYNWNIFFVSIEYVRFYVSEDFSYYFY
jgi:hypothetical protein